MNLKDIDQTASSTSTFSTPFLLDIRRLDISSEVYDLHHRGQGVIRLTEVLGFIEIPLYAMLRSNIAKHRDPSLRELY